MAAEFFDPTDEQLKATVYRRGAERSSLERAVYANETEEQMARRIFREALPMAAASIVDIASNSQNDRTKLDASKYIVERNLGKVGDDAAFVGEGTLADLVKGLEMDLRNETR
jgi:hypothetical protein